MSAVQMRRDTDGVLIAPSGRIYTDPGEALKVHWGNKLILGCNEKLYRDYHSFPCGKSPLHDPDANGRPTKCGIHSAAAKQKRATKSAERQAKMLAEQKTMRQSAALAAVEAALKTDALDAIRQIAAGHNDPRTLATAVLSKHDAGPV